MRGFRWPFWRWLPQQWQRGHPAHQSHAAEKPLYRTIGWICDNIYIYTHTQREIYIYNYIYTYAINMWAGSATRQNTATSLSLQVAVVLFGAGSSWQSVVSGHFPFLPEGRGNLITGQEISLQLQGQSGPTCPMIWIWATPLHSWQPLISSRTSVALVLFALDDLQYIWSVFFFLNRLLDSHLISDVGYKKPPGSLILG